MKKAIACESAVWSFRHKVPVIDVHVSGPCNRCDLPCMCYVPFNGGHAASPRRLLEGGDGPQGLAHLST
jgi:hypothetical protein